MNFDKSLSNFINHPDHYHLELHGNNLIAVEGTPKIHQITHEKLLQLSASSEQIAKDVFKTLREQEVGKMTSKVSIFEEQLGQWVEEKIGTDEYENRIQAATIIRECHSKQSNSLDLSSLNLTSIPRCIGNMSHLKIFDLSSNNLSSLPSEIENLANLKELNLWGNNFSSFPSEITNLTKLETLKFYNNKLSSVPREIKNLSQLKVFDLGANQIDSLPIEICELSELTRLVISQNNLISLPSQIGQLLHLQVLQAFSNNLTSLPPEIENLSELKELILFDNKLRTVPTGIGNLTKLESFNLSDNKLTSLPSSYARLGENCFLSVRNNRMTFLAIDDFNTFISREPPEHRTYFEYTIYEPSEDTEDFTKEGEESLEEAISFWETKLETYFPKESYPEIWQAHDEKRSPGDIASYYEPLLSDEKSNLLYKFLEKLQHTADFKTAGTAKLIMLRVDQTLRGAVENEEFRKKVFLIIEDALGECEDLVTDAFDQIQIQWHLYFGAKALDLVDTAKLLIGLERTHLVDQCARKKINKIKSTKEGAAFSEDVQVFLYLRVKLREALGLPISTENMLYPDIASVTDKEVLAVEHWVRSETSDPQTIISILLSFDIWIEKLKANNPGSFDEIDDDIQSRMDILFDKQRRMTDQDYRKAMDGLLEEKKKRTDVLVLKLTRSWVKENYDEII